MATCSLLSDRCLAGFGLGARFVALISAAHAVRVALIWPALAGRRLWAGRGSRAVCAARSSGALPARTPLSDRVSGATGMGAVVIGMDPHKRSATIEVMAGDETILGGGRYLTDAAG